MSQHTSSFLSRRSFLSTSAAVGAGLAVTPVQGALEKANLAWIGVGIRGNYLLDMFYEGGLTTQGQVVAICDADRGYQERAKDKIISKENKSPKIYEDYRELLADPGIDAVVIATPEHLHPPMALAALDAKKHVYLEKPLAHTIEQGTAIVRSAEASGKVVQVGTQNRSNSLYQKAKEMVQQGMIGNVHYVRAFWYRNDVPSHPIWRYTIPKEASPQNTDWNRFLEDAPKRAWDPRRFFSGACIGITRAGSPPICWSIKPTLRTSCAERRRRTHVLHLAESTNGPKPATIARCQTPSAPFTSIQISSRSHTAAVSEMSIMGLASSSWVTKGP